MEQMLSFLILDSEPRDRRVVMLHKSEKDKKIRHACICIISGISTHDIMCRSIKFSRHFRYMLFTPSTIIRVLANLLISNNVVNISKFFVGANPIPLESAETWGADKICAERLITGASSVWRLYSPEDSDLRLCFHPAFLPVFLDGGVVGSFAAYWQSYWCPLSDYRIYCQDTNPQTNVSNPLR